jgi:AraC family transcriptional regulator
MLRYLADGPRDYLRAPILPKRRPYWELQAVVDGRIVPLEPGRRHQPRLHTLWVWPPVQAHGWSGDGALAQVAVVSPARVPEALARASARAGRDGQVLTWAFAAAEADWLARLVRELAADLRRPDHLTLLRQERAVLELALRILAACPPRWREPAAPSAEQVVERALAWYAEHLGEGPDESAVAAAVHMSPAHLRRSFHRARACAPRSAFLDLALERADELLLGTAQPLAAVAAEVGYASAAAFCRAYARRRGHPPGRVRAEGTLANLGGGPPPG